VAHPNIKPAAANDESHRKSRRDRAFFFMWLKGLSGMQSPFFGAGLQVKSAWRIGHSSQSKGLKLGSLRMGNSKASAFSGLIAFRLPCLYPLSYPL
jgi:hypothetical protein